MISAIYSGRMIFFNLMLRKYFLPFFHNRLMILNREGKIFSRVFISSDGTKKIRFRQHGAAVATVASDMRIPRFSARRMDLGAIMLAIQDGIVLIGKGALHNGGSQLIQGRNIDAWISDVQKSFCLKC